MMVWEMKTKRSELANAWRAANAWELWCAGLMGAVTLVVLANSNADLISPRDPAPWFVGVVLAMFGVVAVLWSDIANLLADSPLGTAIRARDPRLSEVGRPFGLVVAYLVAALVPCVVGFAAGDVMSRNAIIWFYAVAAGLEGLAVLGVVEAFRLNRRFHGWNSELLALKDEAERNARERGDRG